MKENKWKIISSKYNLGMAISQNTFILKTGSKVLNYPIKNTVPSLSKKYPN